MKYELHIILHTIVICTLKSILRYIPASSLQSDTIHRKLSKRIFFSFNLPGDSFPSFTVISISSNVEIHTFSQLLLLFIDL